MKKEVKIHLTEDRLEESEERYRNYFENDLSGMYLSTPEGKLLDCNPAFIRLMGYDSAEEILRVNTKQFYSEQKSRDDFLKKLAENKFLANNECQLLKKNGQPVFCLENVIGIFDKKNNLTGIQGYIVDISERKQAEKALMESEERFRHVAESTLEWIWEVDANGLYTYSSEAVEKILGYTPEEIVEKKYFYDLFQPDARETLKKEAFEVFKIKKVFRGYINANQHKNGKTIWLLTSGVPILDADGNLQGYRGTDTDITEIKQAEEKLRYLSSIIEQSSEGMAIADLDGKLIYINDAWVRMHGYRNYQELIGKNLSVSHSQAQLENEVVPFNKIVMEQGTNSGEIGHITRDGKPFPTLMTTTLIRDENGRTTAIAGIAKDITEIKEAENKLIASEVRYRLLFESAKDGILILNAETGIVEDVNPYLLELLDFSFEELIGKKVWELGFLKDFAENKSKFLELQQHEYIRYKDMPLETSAGKTIDVEFVSNVYDVNHKKVIQCNIRDITERKKARDDLKESEQRFRSIYENSNVGMYRSTPDGQILYANPALLSMLGFISLEELKSRNLEKSGFDSSTPRSKFIDQVEKDGKISGFEALWLKADGNPIYIRESAVALRDKTGKTLFYDGIFEDITGQKKAEKKLIESEERFRQLFNNMTSGVAIYSSIDGGKDFVFVDINHTGEILSQVKKEDVIGKKLSKVFPGVFEIGLMDALRKTLKTGKPTHVPLKYYQDNHLQQWVENTLYYLPSGELVAIYKDTSEKEIALEALRISQDKYRSLVENINDVIYTTDENGIMTYISPPIKQIIGYEADEIIGRPFTDFIYRDDIPFIQKQFRKISAGVIEPSEYRLVSKSGQIHWIRTSSRPILDGKRFYGLQGMLSDITVRKKTENELIRSEEKFRTLYETMAQGVVYQDASGRIISANPAAERILGLTLNQMIGQTSNSPGWHAIHPDGADFPGEKHPSVVALKTGKPVRNTTMGIYNPNRKDRVWININATPEFRDGEKKPYRTYTTFQDITDQKNIENALKDSEEKFKRLFHSAHDSFAYLDLSGRVIEANQAVLKICGMSKNEIKGKHFTELGILPIKALPEVKSQFKNVLRGKAIPAVISMKNRQGKEYSLEANATLIKKQKETTGILIVARDITDRRQAEIKLQTESRRAQRYLDIAEVMLVALNKEARVTLINKAGCRMLGYKEKDIIGKNWFSNFIPKDERESARTVFKNLFKKEIKPVTYHENNILTRGGKLRVIAWHNTAIRDDQGDISGTLSSGTDITEQKRMLNSLMASEERLKILFEYAPDAYYLNDLQGNLIDGNQQAEKLIGQKREMLIGKNLLQVFNLDKNDIAKAAEVLVKNSRGLSTERDEFPITRPDGTRVVLEISTHPVKIGTESLVLGIARDITKPKKMQAELDQYRQYLEDVVNDRTEKLNTALIESETNRDRMDTILKSVQEGLVVSDINHLVVMMNSLAEDWLNMRFSQALNRKVEQVFSQKKILNLINHALSDPSGTSRADIETRDNKTGVNRILEALAKTILDQTQKQIGVLTTLRDVTREREIDRLKTEFLSTTAHELRTPLTTIQGFSEVLLTRNDLTEEEKNKFLGYINKQAVNLSHIISDLLDISRIESGVGFSLKRKICTVNNIISRIMENYRISHPKYRFTSNLETTDAPVFADREKIDQVVQNILSNAINYSPPGTTIRATTKILKDEYQVTIEDRGMGMTEEQVKRIFEKFYRADASDTAPKGTGLGMSIVKLIIDAHQGKVWVESKPGKGTRVIFTLPAGFREEDQKKPDDSGEIITRGFNKRGEEKK